MRERKRTGNDGGRKEGIERSCAHTFTAASATSLVPSPSDGCAACAPRTAGRRECVCVLECECVCVPFVRLRNLYETSPHPPSLVSLSYRLRILSPPPLRARAFASHSQREIHTCAHVRLHHSLSQVRAVFVVRVRSLLPQNISERHPILRKNARARMYVCITLSLTPLSSLAPPPPPNQPPYPSCSETREGGWGEVQEG